MDCLFRKHVLLKIEKCIFFSLRSTRKQENKCPTYKRLLQQFLKKWLICLDYHTFWSRIELPFVTAAADSIMRLTRVPRTEYDGELEFQWLDTICGCLQFMRLQSVSWFFETFRCFTKFSFHHKWNNGRLLLISMVYTSCLTSCRTTSPLGGLCPHKKKKRLRILGN